MGAIWKFFSGEDDTPPAPEQSARRTSLWGLLTGQHDLEPVDEHAATAYHEAGHARSARIGGATVLDINAYPNGGGLTRWDWKPFRENRWTWGTRRYTEEHKRRTELTIYVAGQEIDMGTPTRRHYAKPIRAPAATRKNLSKGRRALGTPGRACGARCTGWFGATRTPSRPMPNHSSGKAIGTEPGRNQAR
jgi:hypothetical protein